MKSLLVGLTLAPTVLAAQQQPWLPNGVDSLAANQCGFVQWADPAEPNPVVNHETFYLCYNPADGGYWQMEARGSGNRAGGPLTHDYWWLNSDGGLYLTAGDEGCANFPADHALAGWIDVRPGYRTGWEMRCPDARLRLVGRTLLQLRDRAAWENLDGSPPVRPPCSPDTEFTFWPKVGKDREDSKLLVCLKKADGSYAWGAH